MKRTLDEIRKDFEEMENSNDKILTFVLLMNELEKDYDTFRIDPSEEFLNKPEVILYREISASRVFE